MLKAFAASGDMIGNGIDFGCDAFDIFLVYLREVVVDSQCLLDVFPRKGNEFFQVLRKPLIYFFNGAFIYNLLAVILLIIIFIFLMVRLISEL